MDSVTTSQSAVLAAQKERDFLAAILETAGMLVVLLDAQGRIIRFNHACCQVTHYTFDEVRGRCFWEFLLVPDEIESVKAMFAELVAGHFPNTTRNYWVSKDGYRRLIAWKNTALVDASGAVEYIIKTGDDITERVAMEDSLRRSEARARGMFETAVDAIVTIDARGIITSFNPAAERLFGYAASEVFGRNINILMPQPYRNEHDGYLDRYIRTRQKRIIGIGREVVGCRKDGTTFPMDLAVGEQRVDGQLAFTGFVRDLTERKRLEMEILQISEREQQRIGQDLHDGLGQHLTGVAYLAKGLAGRLAIQGLPEAAAAERINNLVSDAVSQTRALSRGLQPLEDAASLPVALEQLCESVRQVFCIECVVRADPVPAFKDLTKATHLYRIVQEAVNNAIRHGKAKYIAISLFQADGQLCLRVQDDGGGFGPVAGSGIGLRTMMYRAQSIGAQLDIRPGSSAGVVIQCNLKLSTPLMEPS